MEQKEESTGDTIDELPTESKLSLWFIAPLIFGMLGGITAYLAIKDDNLKTAKTMLEIGTITSFIWLFILIYYLFLSIFEIIIVIFFVFLVGYFILSGTKKNLDSCHTLLFGVLFPTIVRRYSPPPRRLLSILYRRHFQIMLM